MGRLWDATKRPLAVAFRRVSRLLAGKESGISPGQATFIVIGLAVLANGLTALITVIVGELPGQLGLGRTPAVVAPLAVLLVGGSLLYGTSLRLSRRLDQGVPKAPDMVVKIAPPIMLAPGQENWEIHVELDQDGQHARDQEPAPVWVRLTPNDKAPPGEQPLAWWPCTGSDPPEKMVDVTNLANIDRVIEAMRNRYWPDFDANPPPQLHVLLPEGNPHDEKGRPHEAFVHYLKARWPGTVHLLRVLPEPDFASTREHILTQLQRLVEHQAHEDQLATDERRIVVDVTGGKIEQRLGAAFAAARMNCTVGHSPPDPSTQDQPPSWVVATFDD